MVGLLPVHNPLDRNEQLLDWHLPIDSIIPGIDRPHRENILIEVPSLQRVPKDNIKVHPTAGRRDEVFKT
jgi:hypothetical protein